MGLGAGEGVGTTVAVDVAVAAGVGLGIDFEHAAAMSDPAKVQSKARRKANVIKFFPMEQDCVFFLGPTR